ncbi:unnamed protein product [Thlaspi arvense]|uniref:RRM domain-containing protein n=1 Tax=Thlaspi arvense TaxID=13288 RepID=A0AAU9SDX7_THLAR|nr:unnamed protein product [Thlaspi arvense]
MRNGYCDFALSSSTMPRFDDRYGNTRLYVGRLSSRTRTRDLERLFSRYGRLRDVDMKRDYAFVEFSDARDADDARYYLDGRDFDGSRITVEASRGAPRGSRDNGSRGPPPGSGRVEATPGHQLNPAPLAAEEAQAAAVAVVTVEVVATVWIKDKRTNRSRSPVKRGRSVEDRSRSPKAMERSVSPRGKDRSLSPDRRVIDASPQREKQDGSDYEGSPKENGNGKNSVSPIVRGEESPVGLDGHDRSPIDDESERIRSSPKGSESP